nr:uncharacterized protein LOC128780364 [Desmodus rotundus]
MEEEEIPPFSQETPALFQCSPRSTSGQNSGARCPDPRPLSSPSISSPPLPLRARQTHSRSYLPILTGFPPPSPTFAPYSGYPPCRYPAGLWLRILSAPSSPHSNLPSPTSTPTAAQRPFPWSPRSSPVQNEPRRPVPLPQLVTSTPPLALAPLNPLASAAPSPPLRCQVPSARTPLSAPSPNLPAPNALCFPLTALPGPLPVSPSPAPPFLLPHSRCPCPRGSRCGPQDPGGPSLGAPSPGCAPLPAAVPPP